MYVLEGHVGSRGRLINTRYHVATVIHKVSAVVPNLGRVGLAMDSHRKHAYDAAPRVLLSLPVSEGSC